MQRRDWVLRSLAVLALALVAACGATGPGASPDFVYSYAERYPLSGAQVDRIDVAGFRPAAGDAARVARIARDFTRAGQGKIVIFVPQTGQSALASGQWVRQELIAQGVAPSRIQWDARDLPAGMVRVAYAGTGRAAQWDCTNLTEDVQQREAQTSWLNRETVNFGCAYQSNLRAQADNPRDFVMPRPEGPSDPVHAANAVRRLRNAPAGGAAPGATTTGGLNTP